MNEVLRSETTTGRKLNYAFPRLSTSIVLGIEGFILFALYTIGYGVDAFPVGFAQAMGYLSIAAGQFFFGWLSDAKYTKWGRRKPWLVVFSPLLGISFIFLILPGLVLPDLSNKTVLFFWLLIWDIVFRVSYSFTTVYQAWMAEQFPVQERPAVSQFQNTMNYIGNAIMLVYGLLILTPSLGVLDTSLPSTVLYPILIFGVLVIILYITIVFTMPTEPNFETDTKIIKNLKTIVKNKNYMLIVLMQGFASFAWAIITTVMLNFIELVLGLSGLEYYAVAICLVIGFIVTLIFWRKQIQKRGKKRALLSLFLFAVILLPTTLIGLFPFATNIIFGIIFILIIAASLAGWNLFPYIYYADLAEDDEKRTGNLKAGIYTGFPSILLNIFQAFGPLIVGSILSLPDITVGTLTFSLGLVLWGPICSIILLLTYFYTKKYVTLDFEWEK
ncbi:MAG: MFS transporter [Promethearchaeota archaeon]|nr:MAG: MFS transporter [Candidatus Lokiarchaeota archaeon]